MPSGTVISRSSPRAAVEVLALAVHAVAGPAVRVVAERQQRRHVVVGDQPDVAALAAVAAVGPAHRDGALPPEADAAGAAVAAAHVELALVDELGHRIHATGGPSNARGAVPGPGDPF